MKKQNNETELSNFHLQLFSLEEQQNAIKAQPPKEQRPLRYRITALPISISITASIAYFSLYLFWPLLLLDSYQLAYSTIFNNSQTPLLHSITSSLFGIPILGYSLNSLLLGATIITLLFRGEEGASGVVYFLWYFGSRMEQYVRYMVEGLLFSTSYFAYILVGDTFSIILFVLAAIMACFYTVFLQNITLRKDEFCCKSLEFSCLMRICLISSLSVCMITGGQVVSIGQLSGSLIGHLVISGVLVYCYFKFGMITYRHRAARLSLFSLVIFYFCLTLSFLFDLIATTYYSYSSSNLLLIATVLTIIGGFFFLSLLDRLRRQSNHPTCLDLKRKVFFSFNKFEGADEDEEVDCQIRGVMHQHYTRGCKNPECIANLKQCYDSKKKKKCSITKIAQGKVSVIKFYVKCLYETAIRDCPDDSHLELDYLQFYYLKLKNVFTVLVRMGQLEHRYLTFYQRLRLVRIKDYLTQESNQFSRELYHRSLTMCKVVQSEETFLHIQQLIDVVLARNELFWKYLSFNQVQLREIIKIVQPNFELLQTISNRWGQINHYFPINRRWKFYYICFTIFVRNQKVKPAMIQDFGNSVQYDSIFRTGNYFVDKTTEKEHLYNSIMLFQQNTCYLHTRCDQEKMVITKVSNFFHRNLDYDPQEIIGCSLNQLMPPSIRVFHHPMFLTWAKEGRSNNEAFYKIKKIYPMTKRGYLYPCFKFYKRYIQIGGDVEYIAMLKSNRQDEQLMLINSNFEIEGITLSLHHKLKLRTGDYIYLKGINILALMPMLAKYTRHCAAIEDHDEDFIDNDDNQNYFKRQGTIIKGRGDEVSHFDILHQRRVLNLANIRLFLPNDFQATLEQYKHLTNVRKLQQFDTIRELYHWIRRQKNFLKFKAEISIRQRQTLGSRYYEIEINELQENNRLQKLRMCEEEGCIEQSSREIEENRLNEIDMQLFFSMSKKKNKVILFPSKNIFLKDQNNRALTEIAHINNINLFIRLSLLIFLALVLAQELIELSMVNSFTSLTNQFFLISRYEKLGYMLNAQYNIQHIQPGNSWQQSFIIIAYTHYLIASYQSSYFQSLIFDTNLNRPGTYPPYYLRLPTNLTTQISITYDEFAIFYQYYQCAISLHREAELHPQSLLETIDYYQFNNYLLSFRKKAEQIKTAIQDTFQSNYQRLRDIGLIFGIVIVVIVIGCLLFSLSRLLKVANGFKQLVSILIQIDSNDLRDIGKYVDYTRYLFEHLNQKHQRMGLQNQTQYSSTSGNFRSFEKRSSEMTDEEQRLAISSANLNKRIKKIQIGQEITKMMMKSAIILLATISIIGAILLILNIYSIFSLDSYATFEQVGFTFMQNNGIHNILASGAIQKYRDSVLYDYSKYEPFVKIALEIQSSNADLKLTMGSSTLQQNLRVLYFDNFCQKMRNIFNSTIAFKLETICDSTNAIWCRYLQLSQDNLVARCESIQSAQMVKGIQNYNNFFLKQVVPFFNNIANLTLQNVVQINDAYKIIDIIIFELMSQWNDESNAMIANRQANIAIIVVCVFLSTVLLNIVCIEILVKQNLKEKYQIFRLMHEHYIPEWIIVKEKIIKVKLIKEGFMKE